MSLSRTLAIFRAILLFESVLLVRGGMQGELIRDIAFYRDFDAGSSLRCSTVYGTGTQLDRLIGTDDSKINTLRDSLSSDGQKSILDSLKASTDHDIAIFTIAELRSIIVYMSETLDAASLQTYINLKNSWDSLTEEQILYALKTWPPMVHLVMKEKLMCETIKQMNEDALGMLCRRMAEPSVTVDTVVEYLDRCPYCAGIAARYKTENNMIRVVTSYKAIALKRKLQQVYRTGWDIHMLMLVPDALEKEDIDAIISFCDGNQMERLVNSTFYNHLTRTVKIAIAERIRQCINTDLRDWDETALLKYGPYIIHLLTETLRVELSDAKEKVTKLFNEFMSTTGLDMTRFFRIVAPTARQYWSADMVDATKAIFFCVVIKYAPEAEFISSLTHDDLTTCFDNLDSCSHNSVRLTAKQLAPVVERYISDDGFVWDATTITRLAPIMGRVSVSVILSVTDLCSKWTSDFKSTVFPRDVVMKLWEKCKDDDSIGLAQISSWDCAKIKKVGSFISVLKKTDITSIPPKALFDCANYLEAVAERTGFCDRNKGICGAVVQLIKEYITANGASLLDLVNNIGPNLFRALDLQASDFTFEDLASIEIQQLDVEMAGVLWGIVESAKGDLSSDSTVYTSQTFSHISVLFALGGSTQDLLELPEDDGLYSLLSSMSGEISSMSGKKKEIILQKLLAVFAFSSNSEDVCVDEALLREVGMFFARAKVSELAKFSTASLKAVLKTIGQKYEFVKDIPPPKMRTLTTVMLRIERIKDATVFDDNNVGKYGPYLWCGITKTQAERLDSLALTKYLTQLVRCIHFNSATKAAIVTAVKNRLNINFNERPDMLVTLGHFLVDYIAQSAAAKSEIVNAIKAKPWTKKYIAYKISLYIGEVAKVDVNVIGKTERTTYNENKKELWKAVFNNDGGGRRRKRNAGTLTCAEIREYEGQLEFLTKSEAETMSASHVVDCLSEFQNGILSSDVVTVLLNKLKSTDGYGELSTWSSGETASVGLLLDGLTLAEVKQLTFDDEVIASINGFQFQQSSNIITAYLEDTSVSDTSTLDKDTLSLMGTLLCGYSVSEITTMDKTAAFDAAQHVCHITCLTTEQLTAFGTNIASHIGDNWQSVASYVIESMGVCMGGFPVNVLNTFTSEQLGSIQPAAIRSMPATVFVEVFDASMMSHMSSDQANVVTADQIAQMDSSQLGVFNTKLTLSEEDTTVFVSTTDGDGGGGDGSGAGRADQHPAVFLFFIVLLMINVLRA